MVMLLESSSSREPLPPIRLKGPGGRVAAGKRSWSGVRELTDRSLDWKTMFKPQTDRREVQGRNNATTFLSYSSMFHWPRSASQKVWEPVSAAHTVNLLGHKEGWAVKRWERWKILTQHKMGALASGDTETRHRVTLIQCSDARTRFRIGEGVSFPLWTKMWP